MNRQSLKKVQLNPNLLQTQEQSDNSESSHDEDANVHMKSTKCQKFIKIRKSSLKQVVLTRRDSWDMDEINLIRQKAEIKLSSSQLEEEASLDRHNALQTHYERIEKTLEAMLQYIEVLQLEATSSYRLCQLLNSLLVNEYSEIVNGNTSELIKKLCCNRLPLEDFNIKDEIRAALQVSENVGTRFSDFNERKKDYQKASQNFRILLENASLNSNQLKKLQRQFEGILVGYQHSRCLLDQELPTIINDRMQILLHTFSQLSSDLNKVIEDRTNLSTLFKNLKISFSDYYNIMPVKDEVSPTKCLREQ